jgi:hypothetical protein
VARFRAGRPRPSALIALVPLLVGAALLIAAEPLALRVLRVGGSVVAGGGETAGAHHGWALAVLGVALAALGARAVVRRSRAAAAGALVVAAIAAWIVLGVDRPALGDTGLAGAPRELARAQAGAGWRVEVAGVVAALVGAGAACAVARGARPAG